MTLEQELKNKRRLLSRKVTHHGKGEMKSSGLISELIALADLTTEIRRTAEVVHRKSRSHSDTAPGTAQYIKTVQDSHCCLTREDQTLLKTRFFRE